MMAAATAIAKRITRHSPQTVAAIITAVTSGLNMRLSEGLLSESLQSEKKVLTCDLNHAFDALIHGGSAPHELSEPAIGREQPAHPRY